MKALLLTEYQQLQLVDLPQPEIDADAVLVRVAACGICGSDVHGYDGSTGRRVPPLVMGHEAAGVVEAVGKAVTKFQPGERVTFDSTIYCGQCEFCLGGQVNLCDDRQVLGVSCNDYRRNGAFAEWVAVPERVVYRVPDELPLEHAAMIEPVSVAVHAVGLSSIAPDASAVVIGTGMIGLLLVQALRAAGCEQVIAVDVDHDRLALAAQLGAAHRFHGQEVDVSQAVRELTSGDGAQLAYEVVGSNVTVSTAIESVGKGGLVTLVGNLAPQIDFPLQSVVTREITLRGSCASAGEYPHCIELLASGAIDVRPLISATVPLEEGPTWFERLYAKEPGLMKVMLQP